jgi:predicted NBD/HSP70 family sugar kinase
LVVSIEQSLGVGVIHRGEILRAPGGLSPDIGDVLALERGGDHVRLGDVASLAAVLGAIASQAGDSPAEPASRPDRAVALARELAEAGDGGAVALLGAAGRALGLAIANLIALFAPPRLILTGAGVDLGDAFLGPLMRAARQWTPDGLGDVTEIVHQNWGQDMWARGAAAMTLRDLYGAPWNTTGPVMHRLPR